MRDIVDAAFAVTLDDAHDGSTPELTGPASITFHDVAVSFGKALGKDVEYVPVSLDAVEQTLQGMGMGEWFAGLMRDYNQAYSEGWGDFTTEEVHKLTGHPARSIDDFAREVLAPAMQNG